MSKKTSKDTMDLMKFFAGIVFIPILIFAVAKYLILKNNTPYDESAQRVFDTKNLVQPFLSGVTVLAFPVSFYVFTDSSLLYWTAPIAFVLALKIAESMAATHFGVVVDSENDMVHLPQDMANYSLEDYFMLKPLLKLGSLEHVRLSEIERITRQGGKSLFIHGPFGSRGLHYSNKQKRDECIAAILHASKNKISTYEPGISG